MKKPILFVVNNSGVFPCLEDINTAAGDEIVGKPSKMKKKRIQTL